MLYLKQLECVETRSSSSISAEHRQQHMTPILLSGNTGDTACNMTRTAIIYIFAHLESRLCVALAHALASTASALDGAQDTINVRGTTPFLMCQYINSKFFLPSLDQFDIGKHAFIFVPSGEFSGNGSG